MVPRDHANHLTTYKVLVGGAVFLLITVAVALSQSSCAHMTHSRRALGWWSKDDAFTDLANRGKANVIHSNGDTISALREKVKACRISMLSKDKAAMKFKRQFDEERAAHKKTQEELATTSTELIAKKNAYDLAEVHRANFSLELDSKSKALDAKTKEAALYEKTRKSARSALKEEQEKNKTLSEENRRVTSELKTANDAITAKNKKLLSTGAIIDRLFKRITDCNNRVNDTTRNVNDTTAKLAEAKSKLAEATANVESLKKIHFTLKSDTQRGKANVEAAARILNLVDSKKDIAYLRKLMLPLLLKAPLPLNGIARRGANDSASRGS